MDWATEFWGCRSQAVPFKYLGMPVGSSMRRRAHWSPLVELFDKHLSSWKGNLLSIGGRMTLIKAVLSSLLIFYMSIFKIPVGVLKILEEKMRKFLWTGYPTRRGLSLVPWCYVCIPIDKGGMGLIRLELQNDALRLKWIWRFLSDPNALWAHVIRCIHGASNFSLPSFLSRLPYRDRMAGIWSSICRTASSNSSVSCIFRQNISFKLGRGDQIRLWEDEWCSNSPLSHLYPRLYALSTQKEYPVLSFCRNFNDQNHWVFSWRRELRGWEMDSFQNLLSTLPPTTSLSNDQDRITWLPEPGSMYSAHGLYNLTFSGFNLVAPPVLQNRWARLIPTKVGYFLWMALLGRIKTRDNLQKVGLLGPGDNKCPLCNVDLESSCHLFIHCSTATKVWNYFANCLKVSWCCTSSTMSFLDSWLGLVQGRILKQVWFIVLAAVCWTIWRIRNRIVFDGAVVDHGRLLSLITRSISEWIYWSNLSDMLSSQDALLFLQSLQSL